jgi:hypothetical protein
MLAKLANASDPVYAQVPFIDTTTELPNLVKAIVQQYGG